MVRLHSRARFPCAAAALAFELAACGSGRFDGARSAPVAAVQEPPTPSTPAPAAVPEQVAAPVAPPTPAPEPSIPVGLFVGHRAPDFEAVDVQDKRFKLSDYHGKIVALDFWGFW
jgi:hypothetical protein